MKRVLAVLLAVLCCSCIFTKKPDPDKTQYLHDEQGRIMIYHGVNISNYQKKSPGYKPWLNHGDYKKLKDLGFNLVRYLVFFQAIEPRPGEFDDIYINNTIVQLQVLAQLDIDVIVDFHQDLYGEHFGSAGLPDWMTDDNGLPFERQEPWGENYKQPAIMAAFANFWHRDTLQQHYLQMMEYFLKKLPGLKNVVAVDPFNEPYPGAFDFPFEKTKLTEFYQKVEKMFIDQKFPYALFFEPVIYTSTGLMSYVDYKPQIRAAFFPHYYDILLDQGGTYKGHNYKLMRKAMQIKAVEAERLGAPLLYGEFGIRPDVGNHLNFEQDFRDLADQYRAGWTAWAYDSLKYDSFGMIDNDGNYTPRVKVLSYVYPQLIAGSKPIYGVRGKTFSLSYDNDKGITAPTLIFIPKRLKGVKVTVNGEVHPYDPIFRQFQYKNGDEEKVSIVVTWEEDVF